MGKSSKRYKKGDFSQKLRESFSQKMREVTEIEDLEGSGYSDMISNINRIKSKSHDKYYE